MASAEILLSKLNQGRTRSELVARPRLAPRFTSEPYNGVSLICAQAGYGKTSLVAYWLQESEDLVAWLSLDRADNHAARFLAHLLAGIRHHLPEFEVELARCLQTPNPPAIATLMVGLLNSLAKLSHKLIMVLDDYHVIQNQEVHDAVVFLIEHQPINLHLIIASREEPPFSLARLHSHRRLLKYTEQDLCFTQAETEVFLNRLMKLELSSQQSEVLHSHTEGWAAGLQMAALSLSKTQSKSQFIAEFSGKQRHIVDFLVDEVLASQTPEIQDFLICTSILDNFNADLCQAMTGTQDCQAILHYLERNHLFLIALDDNRQRYRYHHLFSELLQTHLERLSALQLSQLHTRAALWYCDHQSTVDALRHAKCAGNLDLIAQILDQHAITMFTRGEVRLVATWLAWLPESVILQYPRVALLAAFNIYFHALPDVLLAERYLSTIDLLLAGDKVSDKERLDLLGKTNVVRGYQARYAGQTDLSLDFFKNAVGSLLNSDLFFDIAMINLAILHATQGRLDASAAILSKYSKISEAQAHLWITMTGIFGLSRIQLIRGNLQSAREICEAGLQQFQERGLQDIPVCSMLHLQLGEIDYLQNRLDEASCHAKRALELAMAGGMELNQACSEVLLVKIKLSQGQISSLTAVYESRLLAFWASVSLVIPSLSGQLAQLWLLQGRTSELTESLAQRGISAKTLRPEWEMEALVLAGLLLQQRRSVEAFDLLTNLHLNAQKEQRYGVLIEIMLLQTLVRLEQNNPKSATQFLCMAMNLAQGSAQLRPFLNAGAGIHLLLRNMDVPVALSLFSAKLLAAFSVMTVAASDQAIEQEIFSLSAKEDKIARLLVTGLSNEEIAAKMFLSPNTVKFHLKSLYRKLDVNKRYDAIQKIRG